MVTANKYSSRVLILATSYAPELRRPELRPVEFPRTDYVELAKIVDCDILDYSIYDDSRILYACRGLEKRLRLDFHLALLGYRRARDYDVVLLMSERVAIPYMMLQKSLGRRCATVFVSDHSSEKQARLVRALNLFDELDVVVSFTHAQRGFLTDRLLIPDHRIRYVMYAVDQQFFVPSESSDDYILSAGGIAGRDYPTLFDAVRDLPVTVKIAASGRLYGPDARRALPSIPPNVEFLPPTDSAGMRDRYQHSSAVVVPLDGRRCDAAGSSVVLEAMCCGRPVIATHTIGMEDYVHENRTGRLVDPGDAESLMKAIVFLRNESAAKKQWGINARSECETRLSLDGLVQGLCDAVFDAASGRPEL